MSSSLMTYANAAAAFAVFPTLVGVVGIFAPRPVLAVAFDVEARKASQDQKLVDNLMRLFSARDLFLGGSCFAAWYNGDEQTLGALLILAAGVVTMDGWVQKDQVGCGAWKHWSVVPGLVGIGAGLLGWFPK